MESTSPTAADLRAALARRRPRLHLYELAALVRIHPVTLSAIFNERKPLDPTLAERVAHILEEEVAAKS